MSTKDEQLLKEALQRKNGMCGRRYRHIEDCYTKISSGAEGVSGSGVAYTWNKCKSCRFIDDCRIIRPLFKQKLAVPMGVWAAWR
jgi:hypothetical protein